MFDFSLDNPEFKEALLKRLFAEPRAISDDELEFLNAAGDADAMRRDMRDKPE